MNVLCRCVKEMKKCISKQNSSYSKYTVLKFVHICFMTWFKR